MRENFPRARRYPELRNYAQVDESLALFLLFNFLPPSNRLPSYHTSLLINTTLFRIKRKYITARHGHPNILIPQETHSSLSKRLLRLLLIETPGLLQRHSNCLCIRPLQPSTTTSRSSCHRFLYCGSLVGTTPDQTDSRHSGSPYRFR